MTRRFIALAKPLVLLLLLTAIALPAWGQGCAMCYTQAASAGARMVQALRSGILVLIFPPMGICIGLMAMSYKKRNRFGDGGADRESDLGW
jgi:hypothetical protein